jgi:hypothetical protein
MLVIPASHGRGRFKILALTSTRGRVELPVDSGSELLRDPAELTESGCACFFSGSSRSGPDRSRCRYSSRSRLWAARSLAPIPAVPRRRATSLRSATPRRQRPCSTRIASLADSRRHVAAKLSLLCDFDKTRNFFVERAITSKLIGSLSPSCSSWQNTSPKAPTCRRLILAGGSDIP